MLVLGNNGTSKIVNATSIISSSIQHNILAHKSNVTDADKIKIENFHARIIEIKTELKFDNRNITDNNNNILLSIPP